MNEKNKKNYPIPTTGGLPFAGFFYAYVHIYIIHIVL